MSRFSPTLLHASIPHFRRGCREFLPSIRRLVAGVTLTGIAALGSGCQNESREPSPPRNVLLITLDTTRFDRLGTYGAPANITPSMNDLAQRGVTIERAYAVTPLTLPSHSSLLTGALPTVHGVRVNGRDRLPDHFPTLAEKFQEAGYTTAAFPAAEVLDRVYGLDRGFDHYVQERPTVNGVLSTERSAEQTATLFEDWLGSQGNAPFFAWLHFFDPHAPYRERPDLRGKFDSAYDAEIHHVDQVIGSIVDLLENRGLFSDTLLCITADHGEGLGDHGELTHGFFVYDSTLRVPLIFSHASLTPSRIDGPFSHVDLPSTLLEAVGLSPLRHGRSRWQIIRGDREASFPEPVYLESYYSYFTYGWSPLQGIVQGNWKLIEAPQPELYQLQSDPLETDNRFASSPPESRALRGALSQLAVSSATVQAPVSLNEDERARLAELGYVVGDDSEARGTTLPLASAHVGADPKDRQELFLEVQQLFEAARALPSEQVLARCDSILSRDPDNLLALSYRGTTLVRARRFEEALTPLQRLESLGRSTASTLQALGVAWMNLNRPEEAIVALERSAALSPRPTKTLQFLAQAESQLGNFSRAVELLTRVLEDPDVPPSARTAIEAMRERFNARSR